MTKLRLIDGQTCPTALQHALDALEVAGTWEWDIASDLVRTDTFVALLFNVDPELAAIGLPLSTYVEGLHRDDQEHVHALIRCCIDEDSPFVAEYRVLSADGVMRWVLDRGSIIRDSAGRPVRGRGIIVEITRSRTGRLTAPADEPNRFMPPLERAVDHVMAAHRAIIDLQDPALKAQVDALLLALGRKLAQQEVQERRRSMN
ncbi:PAS domain-containing protein [Methylobacterium sp. E-066]|uniref:PAS domain-containing protein n=1 Tax=Methylobacterium sp. E-066 TaxID=2836584 RepID=UPI001FBB30EB|nr:PAS domain-containing protein [Methylobacterium sp. E-066]MCJ2138436.1 PAS domain-containing protein [Methylobacterium sp. E-066]